MTGDGAFRAGIASWFDLKPFLSTIGPNYGRMGDFLIFLLLLAQPRLLRIFCDAFGQYIASP